MTRPRILVTGASGVLGSALWPLFDPEQVVALAHHKRVPGTAFYGDVTRAWLGLDPHDYRDLAAQIDVVVHCAASVDFGASPRTLHRLNVVGVGHVVRFVADANAHLIHISTAYVDRHREGQNGDAPLMAAYAHSKATGETMVRESGVPAAIARVSTVIGDSGDGRIGRLQAFHYLVGASMRGLVPFLPSAAGARARARADMIPKDVAARAIAAIVKTPVPDGDYWITAGPAALPISTLFDLAADVAVEGMRREATSRRVYLPAFKPRIVDPETYHQVMRMVLAHAEPITATSGLGRLDSLMASYDAGEPFPTSIGQIRGGPATPTRAAMADAFTATCRHLFSLPKETWSVFL